ncbi:MAG: hypothetical protein CMH31_01385 [Micavibrio sp.]|nr:hypothetical protein [Micavibrio sp.]
MAGSLWFICAVSTAIMWGYSYALSDKVMRNEITPIFLMIVTGIIYLGFSLVIGLATNQLKDGFNLMFSNRSLFLEIMIISACYVAGTFLIYVAINLKNATAVNLIEISYPLFTMIFAYWILKEVQINIGTAIGGAFILFGIVIMYLKG